MSNPRRRDRDHFLGGNEDEEEIVQYGIRRTRRATSIGFRGSSSLSPAQIMEQET